MHHQPLGPLAFEAHLYARLRANGAPLSMRKVSERSEIFPVFHDLFHRRGKQEKTAP